MNNRFLAIGLLTLVSRAPLPAQRLSIETTPRPDKPYVQATGEATISTKPDRAVIDIGVISQGPTAPAAGAQNAKQTEACMDELTRLLGANRKLRTTTYSIRPNYQYPKPGAQPQIVGYTATNVVEVTLDDLSQVSKVIDAATASGANVIQGLRYELKNRGAVHAQALRQAAEQARTNAEAIASGLHLKVVGVLSAEEVTPEEGFGMHKTATAAPLVAGAAPPTPIEIGTIDVDVTVLLRLEVGQ
ncbi:MAG TPA: SIMPL domain-containing protein [Bryobacteraceae bacterium]|nr:SIMPL domain-containing protein [Bryobacteraceae bacterium]